VSTIYMELNCRPSNSVQWAAAYSMCSIPDHKHNALHHDWL